MMHEKDVDTKKEPLDGIDGIRDIKTVLDRTANYDSYNLGLYNGVELCLSILEDRKPEYRSFHHLGD